LLQSGVSASKLAVVGDGKVEIMVGREFGARTLGLASNEELRCGVNPVKQKRLEAAGADLILGDFLDFDRVIQFLVG